MPITGPKLQKEFKKKRIKTTFTSGSSLKYLLCRSQTKLLPNIYPGVWELNYVTHFNLKKILTRNMALIKNGYL